MTTRQSIYKAVDEEIERARKKYPSSDACIRYMGMTCEMGESMPVEIHWAWKLFLVIAAFYCLLMVLGVI